MKALRNQRKKIFYAFLSEMITLSVPKKQVILEFKICPKKQVILPYLESACACKNQLVPNMGNK